MEFIFNIIKCMNTRCEVVHNVKRFNSGKRKEKRTECYFEIHEYRLL